MIETERIGEYLKTDTESIKLIRNSKGYNWEIKILSNDIDRLKELNNKLIEEFDIE